MTNLDFASYLNSGWIQTFSGHRIWPFAPEHAENHFDIEDIAHHLAMQVRWSGAVRRFYSVAEHCVLGSKIVMQPLALRFLMHDAEEAYIGDICRPVKLQLWVGAPLCEPLIQLKEAGDLLRAAILRQLGIGPIDGSIEAFIKDVDDQLMVREALELLKGGPHRDFAMQPKNGWPAADVVPLCWSPEIAERKFLERFAELAGRVPAAIA